MFLCIVYLFCLLHNTDSLLCYNGTFTYEDFGEDPLLFRGVFSPSRWTITRVRCALTIMCPASLFIGLSGIEGLKCFNCSSTHRDENGLCGGDFVWQTNNYFNSSALYLVNCTGENAMCFVRVWSSRAQHSWLVQRGCYQPQTDDPLPRSLNIPTRAMACKHERLPEAEYKVCLCKADWCNSGTRVTSIFRNLFVLITSIWNRTFPIQS